MFSERSLAYWFMDDGYYETNDRTFLFCTESFNKAECLQLIELFSKYGIKSGLKARKTLKLDSYRIRISRHSVTKFRDLVNPYMHKDFAYKLGF